MNGELISVVVGARNAEKTIKECIESILRQSHSKFELIVINDNSTDSAKKILKGYEKNKKVKIIHLRENHGISKVRNIGIKESRGEFIAFTDSDCRTERNWLKELRQGFYSEEIAGVGGANLTPEEDPPKAKCVSEVLSFYSLAGSHYVFNSKEIKEVKHNPSSNSMYRKKVLLELNGFNERLSSNEDPELDYRIKKNGYKLLFNPKAVVYHHRRDSFKKFFSQAKWFGKGRMQAIKIHPGMAEWFRLVPAIAILVLIVSGILAFFYSPALIFFALVSFILFLGFFSSAVYLSLKTKAIYFFNYLIILASWFFGYGIGMIGGVFK